MSQGGSSIASPSAPWEPSEFLVEEAVQKEQDEWEATMERSEVKDVEFEEDHIEVVWLVKNPHQLSRSGVNPHQVQGGQRY